MAYKNARELAEAHAENLLKQYDNGWLIWLAREGKALPDTGDVTFEVKHTPIGTGDEAEVHRVLALVREIIVGGVYDRAVAKIKASVANAEKRGITMARWTLGAFWHTEAEMFFDDDAREASPIGAVLFDRDRSGCRYAAREVTGDSRNLGIDRSSDTFAYKVAAVALCVPEAFVIGFVAGYDDYAEHHEGAPEDAGHYSAGYKAGVAMQPKGPNLARKENDHDDRVNRPEECGDDSEGV